MLKKNWRITEELISSEVLFIKIYFLHRIFIFLYGTDPKNGIGSAVSQD